MFSLCGQLCWDVRGLVNVKNSARCEQIKSSLPAVSSDNLCECYPIHNIITGVIKRLVFNYVSKSFPFPLTFCVNATYIIVAVVITLQFLIGV